MNLFDPEGSGYDDKTWNNAGFKPDSTGHKQSRDPRTGLILKGRAHKTFPLTVQGERDSGYMIINGADKRYYSYPKPPMVGNWWKQFEPRIQPSVKKGNQLKMLLTRLYPQLYPGGAK